MYQKLIINSPIQNPCYILSRVTHIELDRKVTLKSIRNLKILKNCQEEKERLSTKKNQSDWHTAGFWIATIKPQIIDVKNKRVAIIQNLK